MTLTNNYAHAILKEKKTKTEYFRALSVFVFIVNKLGPFKKPYQKLVLCVSSPNPNTSKTIKHSGLRPSGLYYFLGVWNGCQAVNF